MDGQSSATAQESAKWQDVTELFRKAASEMSNLQPMVHTDEFSLQDSMAAVEVRWLFFDVSKELADGAFYIA